MIIRHQAWIVIPDPRVETLDLHGLPILCLARPATIDVAQVGNAETAVPVTLRVMVPAVSFN